jgi:hypothetical protein
MELLEKTHDSVVKFMDGRTIPCSKYVMMTTFPVYANILELELVSNTENGKFVFPALSNEYDVYLMLIEIAHGIKNIDTVTFDQSRDLMILVDFLGETSMLQKILRIMWAKAPIPKISNVINYIDKLMCLNDDQLNTDIMARVCKENVLCSSLERNFLDRLADMLNNRYIKLSDIERHLLKLQRFYPPSFVSKWILQNVQLDVLTERSVVRISTHNSFFYGIDELRSVFHEVLKIFKQKPEWSRELFNVYRASVESMSWNNQIPLIGGISGYHLMFDGDSRETIYVILDAHRQMHAKKHVQLTPNVKIKLPRRESGFSFEIKRGEYLSDFYVRVTASRHASISNPFFECVYSFKDVPIGVYTKSDDAYEMYMDGTIEHLNKELIKLNSYAYVRMDIRFEYLDYLSYPFA